MLRNRKIIVPLGTLLAVFVLAFAVVMVRASADDLLHQAARLLSEAQSGHAIVEVEMRTPEKTGTGTVEVWGKLDAGPEGEPAFRIVVLEASEPDKTGIVAVSDGVQFWMWNPNENSVLVGTAAEMRAKMAEREGDYAHDGDHALDGDHPQTPDEAVDKLLEYFTAERAGTEDVSGTSAHHLRLIPIPEMMPDEFRANGGLLNVWLRTTDNAPLGAEYSGGAIGYGKAIVTQLDLDQPVDDAVFTFDIPDGAEVTNIADIEPPAPITLDEAAATADFALLAPNATAVAGQLVDVVEMRGAIVQRYALPDGGGFTVAQGAAEAANAPTDRGEAVTVRGAAGTLFTNEDGSRSLLTWSENGTTIWVSGDLTPDTAVAIAESLQ